MPATKSMYRPAFSEEEIEVLATILLEAYLLDMSKPPYNISKPADSRRAFSPEVKLLHHGLIGKINTLRAKIANKAITPAYVTRKHTDPTIAMLEDLGAPEAEIAALDDTETKEQYWERCYLKFVSTFNLCTVSEIEAAYEHMYLNDLMTPEQLENFEARPQKRNT
jgi:hypothetical protein